MRSPLVDRNSGIQNLGEESAKLLLAPFDYNRSSSDGEICQTTANPESCMDWPVSKADMTGTQNLNSATAIARLALPATAFSNYCPKPAVNRQKDAPRTSIRVCKLRYWQRDYRTAFPNFVFYLDSIDEEIKRRIIQKICSLGAKVTTTFSFEITHFITTRTVDPERCSPSDFLHLAKKANMKIWSIDKLLNRILFTFLDPDSLGNTSASSLQALLDGEKVYGASEKNFYVPSKNVEYFQENFLCVRDITQFYKPIVLREWERPTHNTEILWPTLGMTVQGRCPFNTGRKRELKITKYNHPAQEIGDQLANQTYKQKMINHTEQDPTSVIVKQVMGDITAAESGVPFQKQTPAEQLKVPNPLTMVKRSAMTPLNILEPRLMNMQNSTASRATRTPTGAYEVDPLAHKKVKVDAKAGYCENCCERYRDLEKHLQGRRHRAFSENNGNFASLDEFFSQVQRPLRSK
ncbi:Spo4-Spo6 kinase complex regulatory subunit Spo6 [Schizosaccharomyces octosporus yFS286]|uniref:Spo4-Spo6 kinase complex regulatory subunit Spo6 n=1 Tax=Schizosaccharomyces octosporus (strain yFS286) TaxID=483514 RepID=S9PTG9_SCHOY|nr:Spo4-Spo6 kinase complex regulatory subunit Spo6 [Schizosaccharomyces octosporus yFS286]EPX72436.1 Spo4-Spo6 kinase complex regulatory subunit Spo6 [Schizosaccharomyces octosporus yFS286]